MHSASANACFSKGKHESWEFGSGMEYEKRIKNMQLIQKAEL
jgi:hypothetical protein